MANLVTIGCAGDLHCGGITGLLPPNFVDRAGNAIGQNFVQSYLWECWQDYCAKAWALKLRAFVLNGDAVDGTQRKNGGVGAMSDVADQRKAARACINYLMSGFYPKPTLYFTKGTPYHAGTDAGDEEALAEVIGAVPYAGPVTGFSVKDVLNLKIGVNVINFAHHIGYAPVNKTMPIYREIQRMLISTLGNVPHADVIVRSHVHYHALVATGAGKPMAFTLPAWQFPTSWMFKGNGYPSADIGAAFIHLNIKDKNQTRVQCELYETPKEYYPITEIVL